MMLRFCLLVGLFMVCWISEMQPSRATPHAPARPSDTSNKQVDSVLQFWLQKRAVSRTQTHCRTLYLWMDETSLKSCIDQDALLTQALPINAITGHYDLRLRDKKIRKNPIAEILRGADYARKRDAWPVSWACLTETGSETPSQLIRVELADSALIVNFLPHTKTQFEVVDAAGRILPLTEIEKRKHHIAAVYFEDELTEPIRTDFNVVDVASATARSKQKRKKHRSVLRTYILCNESMIQAWHHATPTIQNNWLTEIQYLLLLDAWLKNNDSHLRESGKYGRYAQLCWGKPLPENTPAALWYACLRRADSFGPRCHSSSVQLEIDFMRAYWPKQTLPVSRFPSAKIR